MKRSLQWIFLLVTASAFAHAPEPKFVFPGSSSVHGRNQTTRWAYGIYGRMIAETNVNNVLVRTNGYDPNGRLTNQWTAAKGKSTYVYDAVGNLTAVR